MRSVGLVASPESQPKRSDDAATTCAVYEVPVAGCELVYWASINEYNRRRSRNTTQLNHRMGW